MRIELIDKIKSAVGDVIQSLSKQAYNDPYDLSDFTSDDLINLRAAMTLFGAGSPVPFHLTFLSTDPYPVVIGGATAILNAFTGSSGEAPGLIVRELNSIDPDTSISYTKWRGDASVKYDAIGDTLTIDLGTNLDGDITIFKP
jgi:hypothetical protein